MICISWDVIGMSWNECDRECSQPNHEPNLLARNIAVFFLCYEGSCSPEVSFQSFNTAVYHEPFVFYLLSVQAVPEAGTRWIAIFLPIQSFLERN